MMSLSEKQYIEDGVGMANRRTLFFLKCPEKIDAKLMSLL